MVPVSDTIIVICTRMASSRLPGKAMKRIAGVPAIVHILRRCKLTGYPVVLAMPDSDPFDISGKDMAGVGVYRGEPDSPLHRMAGVLKVYEGVRYVVRVTHDDILIDPATIVDLVTLAKARQADYGYTPGIVEGAGVEVIERENLLYAAEHRKEPTEFVSYFVRGSGHLQVAMEPRDAVRRPYRLTMDYPGDAIVLEAVLRATGADARLDDVVKYLDRHQHILQLNHLPELSIYTCAYNAAPYISDCMVGPCAAVRSGIDLEHIILDDASKDETLSGVAMHVAPHVRLLVNEDNKGLASSSNRALSECRAKYAMRLDADDELLAASFVHEWPTIRAELQAGAKVVYPAYLDEQGRTIDPRLNHHAGGAVFDKALLNELRFRDGIRHWDGLELFNRMKALGVQVAYHDAPTWLYRDTPGSMSKSDPDVRAKTLKEIA